MNARTEFQVIVGADGKPAFVVIPYARFRALQRFLDHVEKHERVWVAKRIDVARHWKSQHPFDTERAFVWE